MIERYTVSEVDVIWSEKYKYQKFIDLEIEWHSFLYDLDIHNEEPIRPLEITDECIAEIHKIEEATKHEMAAIVDWLISKTGRQFIHYGLTSSDILDSTLSIQIFESQSILSKLAYLLNKVLDKLQVEYKYTPILSRTHGRAAEITTLSKKIECWKQLHTSYVLESMPSEPSIKISGPSGNYCISSFKELNRIKNELSDGMIFHDKAGVVDWTTQIIDRQNYMDLVYQTISYCIGLEKMILDLRLMSQTGIDEFSESFTEGQKGSSAMPHKRNPILLENLAGLCRKVRNMMPVFMENCLLWHERDMSHSSIERIDFPDLFNLVAFIIKRLTTVLENGKFNLNFIEQNINNSSWIEIFSHDVVCAQILKGKTRKEAYDNYKNINNYDFVNLFDCNAYCKLIDKKVKQIDDEIFKEKVK